MVKRIFAGSKFLGRIFPLHELACMTFRKDGAMLFDLPTFTLIHVVLSLVGIIAGLVVVGGLIAGRRLDGWTVAYFATTVLTSVTGFGFPFGAVLPSHIVGAVSLLVLAVAISARYWKLLSGAWRPVFVGATVAALYLNVFVLLVQLFQKTPGLIAVAPTQAAPAFVVTQLAVFLLFTFLGWAAVKGFRQERAVKAS
jgi:hypothetical protein